MRAQDPSIDPADDGVEAELLKLVDEGLLHMGVNEEGEVMFWPTDVGFVELEMISPARVELDTFPE